MYFTSSTSDKMSLSTGNLAMYTGVVVPFLIFFSVAFLFLNKSNAKGIKPSLPTNWPVVGMIPALLLNYNRIHDSLTELLEMSGGTFMFKGPWFSNLNIMVTSDPANVHYILNKNSLNFPKGPDFVRIFTNLGDGIFAAKSKHWENLRKTFKLVTTHDLEFLKYSATICWEKVDTCLIPILDTVADNGTKVDFQDLFKRLTFDFSCIQVFGCDPGSLKEDMPNLPHERAFTDFEEAVFQRYFSPQISLKLQKWLRIGIEHKITAGRKALVKFMSSCISLKHNIWKTGQLTDGDKDLFTGFLRTFPGSSNMPADAWGSIMFNFVFAGKDTISATLSWLFWLIATHPAEEEKIHQEIFAYTKGQKWKFTDIDDLKKLTYLHGAICEALRLFPPVVFSQKASVESDTLPSGHKIKPNTMTVLSLYSMGRSESIWGKDCREFKPERWISETGRIKNVPSFKFPAFNGGPRSCLGKDISFNQMKIVVAAIINRFRIEVVDGHPAEPSLSIVLHMKYGLKVKVSRRV